MSTKRIALVTGVSRQVGIGASIASHLAKRGWDIAVTYWRPYDEQTGLSANSGDIENILAELHSYGAKTAAIETDLSQKDAAERIFDTAEQNLGPVSALIINHCHCAESDILSTSVESFDRHFAVNSRGTWLLVREFGRRFSGEFRSGRIISITSDHTAGNLPYGASKGAMDRIVLAAAWEFRSMGITANVINPGATDTEWMSDELKREVKKSTLLNRIGMPGDCANLVGFLCSKEGGWINAQLLYSNGGL